MSPSLFPHLESSPPPSLQGFENFPDGCRFAAELFDFTMAVLGQFFSVAVPDPPLETTLFLVDAARPHQVVPGSMTCGFFSFSYELLPVLSFPPVSPERSERLFFPFVTTEGLPLQSPPPPPSYAHGSPE